MHVRILADGVELVHQKLVFPRDLRAFICFVPGTKTAARYEPAERPSQLRSWLQKMSSQRVCPPSVGPLLGALQIIEESIIAPRGLVVQASPHFLNDGSELLAS